MIKQRTQDRLVGLLATSNHRIEDGVWGRMDAQQRIEALTGHSLDECRHILDLPTAMAVQSPTVMTGKVQVIRAILNCVTRVGIATNKIRSVQDEILTGMINDFDAESAKAAAGDMTRPAYQGNGNGGRWKS